MLYDAEFTQNCDLPHLVAPFSKTACEWRQSVVPRRLQCWQSLRLCCSIRSYDVLATPLARHNGTPYICNTHLHLEPRLRMSGGIHPLALYAFMAWTDTTSPSPFTLHLLIFVSCFVSPHVTVLGSAFKLAATTCHQRRVCFVVWSSPTPNNLCSSSFVWK